MDTIDANKKTVKPYAEIVDDTFERLKTDFDPNNYQFGHQDNYDVLNEFELAEEECIDDSNQSLKKMIR